MSCGRKSLLCSFWLLKDSTVSDKHPRRPWAVKLLLEGSSRLSESQAVRLKHEVCLGIDLLLKEPADN